MSNSSRATFDSEKTCKDAVLEMRPDAVCVRFGTGWRVEAGAEIFGTSGRGPAYAWRLADEELHQQ